ncbi:fructose-bisphosphate aldolase [Penicillium malachiteum]|uniref:fructose-bisphosphate aldolase n=1 Tax=Penicillium malachiteum TaxID=1324776 RepID=UPI0025468F3F|nr:fructose-bisphosphate aldolase [Penicillium malachiteum]KAJ5737919.1 fructose-bisphosphate aldolase [Penicillium malachiteum]
MSWKDSNCHNRILRDAENGRYGVIAAIAYNIEQILGLVRAAETARSPLIIQFFPWAIEATDGMLVRAAADIAKRANIIKRAADLPFDSIMVDMSHYEKEINLKMTHELVQYCNEREKSTEAEPGRIEGGEDGVMDTVGLEVCMTTAEEVDELVSTGVDVLALSFGNVHGEYGQRSPQLDFERFERIRAQADGRVHLALHGTNGFAPELLKRCVAAGVTKINVNRLVLDDYYDHLHANVEKIPHTQLMKEGIQKVADLTIKWMDICGSAGRA